MVTNLHPLHGCDVSHPFSRQNLVWSQSGVHPLDPDKVQPMRAYADADFMGSYTRKSTSGWMIMFAGSCWIYSSKLQTLCSMSTAESEVNSAVECSKSIVHAKLLLKELGFLHQYSQPVTVHEDNSKQIKFVCQQQQLLCNK